MVLFNLKHQENSLEEQEFFHRVQKLSLIPEVHNLKHLRQLSQKNPFKYALSMTFNNFSAYQNYINDERHDHFVKTYWLTEVTDFMELDLTPLSK
jgi:hypothetical protein